MNAVGSIALIVLAGLAGAGCVAVRAPAPTAVSPPIAQSSDGGSCREITANRKVQTYCGSPGQWQEFDRRMALVNAGVTCRNPRTPQELCLTARQWARVDRMAANRAQAANMGSEAQSASGQQYAGLQQVSQQWLQATGMTYPNMPAPPPPPPRQ